MTLNIVYLWVQCRGIKTRRMLRLFQLLSDSTVMLGLIFMTSTGVLQSLDSIKVCPLPSINIFFMAREVRERRNKLLHGWDAFLNLIPAFYQPRSCSVTCRDRQNRTSVWLTSSTHLSFHNREVLIITVLAVPPLHILSVSLSAHQREGQAIDLS